MSRFSTESDASAVVSTLKAILRDRKISYQELADELDVSLPTVKRMLNKPMIPLDRLMAICRIADVELGDVLSRAESLKPTHYEFSIEQDALFHSRPEFLAYFLELGLENKSPDEIATENQLNQRSTDSYLIGLAKIGLIERQMGNDVRLLVKGPYGFGAGSLVLRSRQAELIEGAVKMVMQPESDRHYAILKPVNLPEGAYREMIDELNAIVDKFAYLSESRKFTGNEPIESWNLSIAAGPYDDNNEAAIVNI